MTTMRTGGLAGFRSENARGDLFFGRDNSALVAAEVNAVLTHGHHQAAAALWF